MSVDKRVHSRAPLALRVVYQRLNAFIADYTHNLSKGGTFIKTGEPLVLGTELDFKLSIPHRDDPFALRGKVVWVTSVEDATEDAPAGMGLMFVWGDDKERIAFEETVNVLIDGALGPEIRKKLMDQADT